MDSNHRAADYRASDLYLPKSSGSISFDRLKRSQIVSFCTYSRVQRDNLNNHNCTNGIGFKPDRKAGD
jgi:hypothetical protein